MMQRQFSTAKLVRAAQLRDAAVDLVVTRGKMTGAKFMDRHIEIDSFENERVAILYKTPQVNLDCPNVPASVNPKGFGVDIWSPKQKVFSAQWDHDGPLELLLYKPGEWEACLETEEPQNTQTGYRA